MKLMAWILVSAVLQRSVSGAVFKKVGDEVVLKLRETQTTDAISSILWLHNSAMVVDFDKKGIEYFRQFKERTKLNISNGELTITGLTLNDSGLYTAQINNLPATISTQLKVLTAVPVPVVNLSCDDDRNRCTLECIGNVQADAEPVYYNWKFGDVVKLNSSRQYIYIKEDDDGREISCEMENAVSQEGSSSILDPFTSSKGDGLRKSTGIIVFISLLGVMLLVVVFHKCATGKWFFQKGSMPWKAAFWMKEESTASPVI